jgi:hypothetical protein
MSRNLDIPQSSVHRSPYGGGDENPAWRSALPAEIAEVHMESLLDEYASGKLDPACVQDVETHMLVCDACFAAYVALCLRTAT